MTAKSPMPHGGLSGLCVGLVTGILALGTASADEFTIPEIGPGGCVSLCGGATSIPELPAIPTDPPSIDVLLPDVTTPPAGDVGSLALPSGSPQLAPVPSLDTGRGFEAFKDEFQVIGALQSRAPSDLVDFRDLADPIVRGKGLLRFLDAGAWMLVERGYLAGAAREYAKAATVAARNPELRESLNISLMARYDDAVGTGADLRVLELLAQPRGARFRRRRGTGRSKRPSGEDCRSQ